MIEQRLSDVRERIGRACERAGRDSNEVELMLVTKEVGMNQIEEAYRLGIRDFGENRVQEFLAKRKSLPQDIRWHFIGTLQTNKVKFLVGEVHLIHSCDRVELAQAIQKQAAKTGREVPILLEVNTSGEKTKHGFPPETVPKAAQELTAFNRLKVRGLMTIGPNTEDQNEIRRAFRVLRTLRDELQRDFSQGDWNYLSMGMSADFELAIAEGANLLRIGTAVFGPRRTR